MPAAFFVVSMGRRSATSSGSIGPDEGNQCACVGDVDDPFGTGLAGFAGGVVPV